MQSNSKYIYDCRFHQFGRKYRVGEIDILMPIMPEQERIINYGLPKSKQKFNRREVPKDIKTWDKKSIDEYVANEWHIRRNGYWIYIKGEPFYIPGCADFFFNYWYTEMGIIPEFRIKQLEWFYFWWNVERDENCYGLLDIKSRRGGDTEMSLCAIYERTTRFKNMKGGMIHISETGVKKNFRRLVMAHVKMPFFFKPINTGAVKPTSGGILFDIPEGVVTKKSLKEGNIQEVSVGLNSEIIISPAFTGAFDTDRLGTYYADEVFKVKSHRLDVLKQWGIVKRTLHLFSGEKIVGKAIKTSTVEQVEEDGEVTTVDVARTLWDDSDPNNKNENGRTISGLYRIFRGYEASAPVDEWGFPMIERVKKRRDNLIKQYKKERRWDLLLELYRKEPATIDEALVPSMGEGLLFPELCHERMSQLESGLDYNGRNFIPRGSYGDLVWKDKFGGTVEWIPSSNGKWYISQHPIYPNRKHYYAGRAIPANMAFYRCGVDPYDSAVISGKGSDGGIVVKRVLDVNEENRNGVKVELDEYGNILNPEVVPDMTTNQVVCDYRHRNENPYDFYDDVLKTIFYYGIQCFPETTKDAFRTWMLNNNFDDWLQPQPPSIQSRWGKKGQKGMAGNDRSIDLYIDRLKMHISSYIWCEHHPRVIKEWAFFTRKDRTKFDLTVASGYAEIASMDIRYVEKGNKEEDKTFDVYESYTE